MPLELIDSFQKSTDKENTVLKHYVLYESWKFSKKNFLVAGLVHGTLCLLDGQSVQ